VAAGRSAPGARRGREPAPHPGVAEAVGYAEGVVAGAVPACRLVRLACGRFLRDKAEAEAGRGPWAFRPGPAEAAMRFAGLLPNIKGPEPGGRCA
jgi:hypothetical protein